MAMGFFSNEVSDLCIGKPALRTLQLSSTTIGDALLAIRRGSELHLAVLGVNQGLPEKKVVTGKICITDIICYLCFDGNLALLAAALIVLESLDLILDGAQNLVVPIRSVSRKKLHLGGSGGAAAAKFYWLTHEDFVWYFLNSIALFSPNATLSIDARSLVRPATTLTIRHDEPSPSLIGPLFRRALSSQSSVVVVVTEDGRLLGDISPPALAFSDETVTLAAGIATLTADDLLALFDYSGSPRQSHVHTIKVGPKEKGMRKPRGITH
ncbi:CBS domain-containing protein CBSX5-like [Canna indica]|uniref:CBS domain-containing protein CBSX5-like n=1 Tax=Canna indica TaxID=4628 RepID=A0AAQ3L6Z4_9LILI|nr:CBS domain-containing protein CBSX5-like [Canna indica]